MASSIASLSVRTMASFFSSGTLTVTVFWVLGSLIIMISLVAMYLLMMFLVFLSTTKLSGETLPLTTDSPRPQAPSKTTRASPVEGSELNMTPAFSESTIFCTMAERLTLSCSKPCSTR